jgi:hypothetical protein
LWARIILDVAVFNFTDNNNLIPTTVAVIPSSLLLFLKNICLIKTEILTFEKQKKQLKK